MKNNKYTKVPHEILDSLISQQLTSREFRVILCVLRETWGWHRDTVRLSNARVSELTGIAKKHIPAVKKSLLSKKLIDQVDCKLGSILTILCSQSPEKRAKSTLGGSPQVVDIGVPKLGSTRSPQVGGIQSHQTVVDSGSSGPLKKVLKKNHSKIKESEVFSTYFEKIERAPRKAKSEERDLFELLNSGNSLPEIEAAFRIVTTRGMIGRKGEKPNNPIAYIASHIDNKELQSAIKSYTGATKTSPVKTQEKAFKTYEKSEEWVDHEDKTVKNAVKHFKTCFAPGRVRVKAQDELTKIGNKIVKSRCGFDPGPALSKTAFRYGLLNWFDLQNQSMSGVA